MPTATDLDTDLLQGLDFEYVPPCEEDGCDNPAAWHVSTSCCHESGLLCDQHRKVMLDRLAQADPTEVHICRPCKRLIVDLQAWILWWPL